MAGLVLIPRDLAERVTEIANRNEQSAEGNRLAALLSSPAPSLPEDVERVVARLEEPHHMDRLDAEAAALIQSLSSQLAERDRLASALRAMLREHDILSGNFGDVVDPKHVRPDRWPNAASLARAALASLEERT